MYIHCMGDIPKPTANPRTEDLDFRGLVDSVRLSVPRAGTPRSIGDFPEI